MAKAPTSIMRRRMWTVLVLFMLFGFAVVIVQLFRLQIIEGEYYQSLAIRQQTTSTMLGAKRGTIYDKNENPLAKSATVWNICISPPQLSDKQMEDPDLKMVETLCGILDVKQETFLEKAADKKSRYIRIKMRVERPVYEAVNAFITENSIEGVFAEEDTKRYYPYGNFAATVLGFTNFENKGAYGIESYYDKILSGTPGTVISAKNAWGSDMPFKYQQLYEAQDGNSIVLTIDEAIQHFLEKNLEIAVVEHNIQNRATGIVMDVKTGAILAMTTKPDFDPNDPYTLLDPHSIAELSQYTEGTKDYKMILKELQYDQWRNKAISDPYEPGSVFKIITASAALESGAVNLNDSFYCPGYHKVGDRTIRCWKRAGHGQEDFVQGMQHSCNPVFMTIAERTGAANFYSIFENYGFTQPTGIDLPGEATSIYHPLTVLSSNSGVNLASTSMGQTFKVTPIQLITGISAAVNGGNLMQPYIVQKVIDPNGNVIETTEPTVIRQVISQETSETMRVLVEAVVNGGSGGYAAVPGFRIGGKTGTSEKLDTPDPDDAVLSFVGIAPVDDPQIAILVLLDTPELDNIYGSTIAAPVVGAIMQDVLPYLHVQPQFTEEELAQKEATVPALVGEKPHDAQSELTLLNLKTRIVGAGTEVVRQIPAAGETIDKGGTVILFTDMESASREVEVPNVMGMSGKQANQLILNAGLNIVIHGQQEDGAVLVVINQEPAAGDWLQVGGQVDIYLGEKDEALEDEQTG